MGTVMSRLHRGRKALQQRLWHLATEKGIVKPGNKAGDAARMRSEARSVTFIRPTPVTDVPLRRGANKLTATIANGGRRRTALGHRHRHAR